MNIKDAIEKAAAAAKAVPTGPGDLWIKIPVGITVALGALAAGEEIKSDTPLGYPSQSEELYLTTQDISPDDYFYL